VQPERFLARPRRTLVRACALLALVVVWTFVVPHGTRTVDRHWWAWMEDTWSYGPGHLARFLAWLGNGYGRALAVALLALPLLARRRWLALAALGTVELLTPFTTALLKDLSNQARPPERLVNTHGSSFPSGHTSYAAATLVALVLLYSSPGSRRRLWWALVALGTVAMAWSRTYLHAHWLSDVIAGGAWGWALALAVFAVAQLAASSARYASAFPGSMNHSK
jgi:membrane-associated phospholipid phosphatase